MALRNVPVIELWVRPGVLIDGMQEMSPVGFFATRGTA